MGHRVATKAAVVLVAVLVVAGCGGDEESVGRSASLDWSEKPKIYVHPTLKDDRVLRGEVKNGGFDKIRVETNDIRVLDRSGRIVPAAVTFAPSYVHSLYTRNRLPRGGYPEEEKRRIGLVAEIKPGKTALLTVSWRQDRGTRPPVRIDYGTGSLEVRPAS
jgi:hypothetical protein